MKIPEVLGSVLLIYISACLLNINLCEVVVDDGGHGPETAHVLLEPAGLDAISIHAHLAQKAVVGACVDQTRVKRDLL